mmetsp:Transcript_8834/g.40091  ORF Transcript_8834/g.40091 Transcript_8834/m.40091 type:complete len:244 (+) Transcript_8834:1386-2117(+)
MRRYYTDSSSRHGPVLVPAVRRARERHLPVLVHLRVRDVPVMKEDVRVRHRLPLRLGHHRLRLVVVQHPHETLLTLGVDPGPLAVPRPAVPAAPEAAQEPEYHVHHHVAQEESQENERGGQQQQPYEEHGDGAEDRVREAVHEPRRQMRHLRTPFALPLVKRVRPGLVHVRLRRVHVVRRAQRAVGQRAVRARHHAHGLGGFGMPALVRVDDARELVVRALDLRRRARPRVQTEDLVIVVLVA